MWYEVLPAGLIMAVCLATPQVTAYFIQKFFQNGNPMKRDVDTEIHRRMFLRDKKITGSPYIVAGLESIPDED